MLRGLFSRNTKPKLQDFLDWALSNEESPFKVLGLNESDFQVASHEDLMENPDDIATGVTHVRTKFDTIFFDLFDSMLVKTRDNDSTQYIFYTQTADVDKILEIAEAVQETFELGIYDDRQHESFSNKEAIKWLANNSPTSSTKEIVQVWSGENYSVTMQYRVIPLRQFVLSIERQKPKEIDKDIRRNGTILDLTNLDIESVLTKNPIEEKKTYDNELVKFVDYVYPIEKPEFGVFDRVEIRIFGTEREFNPKIQTHVTWTSQHDVDYRKKIEVVESLVKIYGEDDSGSGDLAIHELDMLEEDFWTGRRWSLNESHGLWDVDDEEDKMSYTVCIELDESNGGFSVCILSYDQLVDLFGLN